MFRPGYRLAAAFALPLLLAACSGGGGSHAVPTAPGQNNAAAVQSVDSVSTQSRGALTVNVHLPLRNAQQLEALVRAQSDKTSPQYQHWLTPAQFRDAYGASASDVQTAKQYLQMQGFTVTQTSQGLIANGSQRQVESTFGVHMRQVMSNGRSTLSADHIMAVPQVLTSLGATVSVPHFKYQTHAMKASSVLPATGLPQNRRGPFGAYWFDDLKQAYGYPAFQPFNGAGRTIATVISSDVLNSDTELYFRHELLTGYAPVQRRFVNGGAPFDPTTPDSFEADLDVQQEIGSAPGAQAVVYDIPVLDDANIIAGYQAVVDDNRADIVNSSFGECELDFTKDYNNGVDFTFILTQQFHDVFLQGNAQGITFVASSGDFGAFECLTPAGTLPAVKGVSHPAIDPNVTAVGGTNLQTTFIPGGLNSTYVSENAFQDPLSPTSGLPSDRWGSGGGVSVIFDKPPYQRLVGTGADKRSNPDISMHMGGCPIGSVTPCDPARSSDIEAFNGSFFGVIGTSASSPEFCGLLAVLEQRLGGVRLGNANFYIYALAATAGSNAFNNNIPGFNGYPSTPGYNFVVGNGTPKAAVFAQDPTGPFAGEPQTPSNP